MEHHVHIEKTDKAVFYVKYLQSVKLDAIVNAHYFCYIAETQNRKHFFNRYNILKSIYSP